MYIDKTIPIVMTIAGSDSSGGAGIQADLKTFAANKVYGTSVITAVTSQNTLGVDDVFELPVSNVISQIEANMSDVGANVIKIGMLSTAEIIKGVHDKLTDYPNLKIVLDPVMVAKGGDSLLRVNAIETLKDLLLPMAYVVTPNVPEATVLTGIDIDGIESAKLAAMKLYKMGANSVVIKGGHINNNPVTDLLYNGDIFEVFSAERINTMNTHGTGCTFASALACGIAIIKQ